MSKRPKKQDSVIPAAFVRLTGTIIFTAATTKDGAGMRYLRRQEASARNVGATVRWMTENGTTSLMA